MAQVYHGGRNQPEQVTDEYLSCFYCKSPGFHLPARTLLCGHISCDACIRKHISNGFGDDRQVVCPTCQRVTKTPQVTHNNLQNNVFVETQVDRLLRRHNAERQRNDMLYNIHQYRQDGSGKASFVPLQL
ncbi:hypothetical protein CAPTEDRAFT_215285 [Capitella teleta]|uniref:RING-type domain-containing protein n=1 Tax=Capitella teleta TaxID=283909 RepID=R7VG03_CAPTE|nr:hypothetical protein CAPTEDRAFT_215285 [Capitella teleta]|eukprot:ELU17502.1 hypothetical protein CAPTEDRAFT_215285 [Capitella teleta]